MYLEKRTAEGWIRKKEYTKKWWENAPAEKRLFYAAKQRAKKYGLDFDIEESDINIPEVCPILDIPLQKSYKKQASSSPSLDRVDSSKGYVKGNVRVISYKANACKSNMTPQQVEALYRYVFRL